MADRIIAFCGIICSGRHAIAQFLSRAAGQRKVLDEMRTT